MEQRGAGGAGGAHQHLQAGVPRRAAAGGPAGEGAGEALAQLPHRQHRAVGGAAAAPLLQRRAQPAAAQPQQRQQPGGDQQEAQPHALVLRLRVLRVRRPAASHPPPACRLPPAARRAAAIGGGSARPRAARARPRHGPRHASAPGGEWRGGERERGVREGGEAGENGEDEK